MSEKKNQPCAASAPGGPLPTRGDDAGGDARDRWCPLCDSLTYTQIPSGHVYVAPHWWCREHAIIAGGALSVTSHPVAETLAGRGGLVTEAPADPLCSDGCSLPYDHPGPCAPASSVSAAARAPVSGDAAPCPLCGDPDDDVHHVTIGEDEGEPGRACIKGQGWRPRVAGDAETPRRTNSGNEEGVGALRPVLHELFRRAIDPDVRRGVFGALFMLQGAAREAAEALGLCWCGIPNDEPGHGSAFCGPPAREVSVPRGVSEPTAARLPAALTILRLASDAAPEDAKGGTSSPGDAAPDETPDPATNEKRNEGGER